ncbi:MAG: DUF4837 family protein, partial [Paludibacter sp.]|nr:DUF4837 family protein [Paludibacter sp.]
MKTKLWLLALPFIFLTSCDFNTVTLPSVSGTQYEILVVMGDSAWQQPSGRSLVALLDQDMYGLPQPEPMLDVHQCTPAEFTDVLKPSRNLLITDISDKYTAPKITYGKNRWATPQSIVKIVAPNDSVFAATVEQYGKQILDYFIRTERERSIEFNKQYVNEKDKAEIEKMFGIQINIPQGISKATKKKDFYWITNDQVSVR